MQKEPAGAKAGGGSGYVLALAAQLLGRCGSMLANLGSLALIARVLPEAQFGIFVLVTGLVGVLVQISDFGTGPVFGQHVGATKAGSGLDGSFWASFALVRLGLGLIATTAGWILSLTFAGRTAGAMVLASLSVFFVAARYFDPLYQVAHRPFRSTMTQAVGAGSIIGLSSLAAALHPTLLAFLLAFLVANALYAISCWLAARDLITAPVVIDAKTVRRILRVAAPLGLAGLMTAVNGRANLLFLEHFRGPDTVATYGAAARVLDLGINLAVLVLSPLIPVLSRSAQLGLEPLAQDVRRSVRLLLQLTLPLLVATPGLSPLIIRLLFGAHYAAAAPVLTMLAFVGFGVVFSLMTSYALLSLHVTHYAIWITGIAVVINLALNALLVPYAGALGAAGAQICSEGVLVTLVVTVLLRHVPGAIDGMGTAKLIVAAAAGWLLMSLIPPGLRVGSSLLVACASAIPLVQLWRERRIQVK